MVPELHVLLQKDLHQLQQHILLLKHAAHQHGVEHSSRLGVMLYDDGFALADNSNNTVAKPDSAAHSAADLDTLGRLDDVTSTDIVSTDGSDASIGAESLQQSHRTHHSAQHAISP